MPAFAAESACLRCCQRCGGLLLQRPRALPPPLSIRPLHTTSRRRALDPQEEYNDWFDQKAKFRSKNVRPSEDAPQASKIAMERRFNLADASAQDGPILVKNYERNKHGKKAEVLEPLPKPDAEDIDSLAVKMREEDDQDVEYNMEDVIADINGIKDVVVVLDSKRRSKERKIEAIRKLRPRHNEPEAVSVGNMILYATYDGTLKRLTRTYTQEQLSAYVQDFLGKADRSKYKGATDIGDMLLSGQGLHSGWRAEQPKRGGSTEEVAPWLRLPYGATRSARSVADRIIRVLWQFEIEEEVRSVGTLFHNVDNKQAPFFAEPRQAQALTFIGSLPGVSVQISAKGDRIKLSGSKYDCFDAERILKSRIAELTTIHVDTDKLFGTMDRRKLLQDDILQTIPTAFGCVVGASKTQVLTILGPNKDAADECERAIVSVLCPPHPLDYTLVNCGSSEGSFSLVDDQVKEALSWRDKQQLHGRLSSSRTLRKEGDREENPELSTQPFATAFQPFHKQSRSYDGVVSAALDDLPADAGDPVWTSSTSTLTDLGLVLHWVRLESIARTVETKTLAKPGANLRPFAPMMPGLAQLLNTDTSLRQTEPSSTGRFARVRLEGRAATIFGDKRPPSLDIDVLVENKIYYGKASITLKTSTLDIMLPEAATDIRCTTTHTLQLADSERNSAITSFAERVKMSDGMPQSSPWSLQLRIPSWTLQDRGAAPKVKTKRRGVADTMPAMVRVDYYPVALESVETKSVPYRGHSLEMTRIDGGPFGGNVEKVGLRMVRPSTDGPRSPQNAKAAAAELADDDVAQEDVVAEDADDMEQEDVTAEDADVVDEEESSTTPESTATSRARRRQPSYPQAVIHLVNRMNKNIGHQDFVVAKQRSPEATRELILRRQDKSRRRDESMDSAEGAVPFERG